MVKNLFIDLTIHVFFMPSPDNVISQATQHSHESRATSDQTPFFATSRKRFLLAVTGPNATLGLRSIAFTQLLSWRPTFDAHRVLCVDSHNTTSLSSSNFHRSRHHLEVFRFPTRPHETRAKYPDMAERSYCVSTRGICAKT